MVYIGCRQKMGRGTRRVSAVGSMRCSYAGGSDDEEVGVGGVGGLQRARHELAHGLVNVCAVVRARPVHARSGRATRERARPVAETEGTREAEGRADARQAKGLGLGGRLFALNGAAEVRQLVAELGVLRLQRLQLGVGHLRSGVCVWG